MQVIIQRVSSAMLVAGQSRPRKISRGIVALAGIEKGDGDIAVRRMAERLLSYRIFPDTDGRMNLNLSDIDGDLLLLPNFTVAANTKKGTRPSFSTAASPDEGRRLFTELILYLRQQYSKVEAGEFGADMQITLTNDGPVTFILNS